MLHGTGELVGTLETGLYVDIGGYMILFFLYRFFFFLALFPSVDMG